MKKPREKRKEYTRIRVDSGNQRRILILMVLLGILGFVPAVFQFYRLMVVEYWYYEEKALNNQTRTTRTAAQRGTIYDVNMNILACQETVEDVYLNPQELRQAGVDVEAMSQKLAQILELDSQWVCAF